MADSADRHDCRPSISPDVHPEDRVTLLATVQESDDQPDECTIYPAAVDPDRRTTTWMTATEGSYVALEDSR